MSQTIYDAFDVEYRIEYLGIKVHPEWKRNIRRWQYYSDSYNGGNEYRAGQYLIKYILESGDDYENRIRQTALDNHCKGVIETYNSFLFRVPPKREYGAIGQDPAIDAFFDDCDLDGRSFNAFMRDVSTYSSIYGHIWVMIDKPDTMVATRADELRQQIRPYVSMITPENVLDWSYERQPNGVYQLQEITLLDGMDENGAYFRTIDKEFITIKRKISADEDAQILSQIPNKIGVVPCIPVYAGRTMTRGVGCSDLSDIADVQRNIYNQLSELEQLIRISNHPSLVKTSTTQAAAGAGAVIDLPDDLDPNLKPFLLEPNGSGITQIISAMQENVASINRMANVGGVRATATREMSGVALQTEFQLLNARLSQKADLLELAEEQIWRMWALWQNRVWDGMVDYPDSFNVHDRENTITMLKLAKETKPENPKLLEEIDIMLAKALITDEDKLAEIMDGQQQAPALQTEMVHKAMTNPTELVEHMKEMIEQGYTTQQILELHPELAGYFNREGDDNDA